MTSVSRAGSRRHHLRQVVRMLRGQPRGDRQGAPTAAPAPAAPRRGPGVSPSSARDGRAHRVADQDRRRGQPARDVLDVGDVVVEAGDEQRLAAAALAVPAQRQRVGGPALARRTRAGSAAPSTRRRSSRRGRTAAAACASPARAAASALRGGSEGRASGIRWRWERSRPRSDAPAHVVARRFRSRISFAEVARAMHGRDGKRRNSSSDPDP